MANSVVQPFGTVTLVFTDIEGSTRLLSELGQDGYRKTLSDHREQIRRAFARHGGYEVDYEGDSFFYAFAGAAGALDAVTEALAELDGGPIRIRVGVHTGEPGLDPPKYVGLDVHKAARIMAAGHGGQALVSHATRSVVGDRFPLCELGDFRLKDFTSPERLYQIGMQRFPALRTSDRTNLPRPATGFLGREREIAELTGMLRQGVQVITLTGPGGAGKTRLALKAVAEASDGFGDGVWWIPLASVRDPGLVLPGVARTIGVSEEPGRELTETLGGVLTGKRVLFLFDNAEHLLPDLTHIIGQLREAAGAAVVVTSRERLQLTGERVYPVPPLTEDDGIELFRVRSAALDPGFDTTAAVAQLCARLDRLPLAIELAAARTAVLSPNQILQRLSERFDLLKSGGDADPRQRTLRSTIDWSYDLLDSGERTLFARLALFAAGCTLEAAEEICGADIDTLASLVDKSLVRRTGERYWMLETIREYAAERFEQSAGAQDVCRRHWEFYEHFAETAEKGMFGRSVRSWFGQVDEELPNLRSAMARSLESGDPASALRTATSLHRYWQGRSGETEGRTWLDRALATGSGPIGDRAKGSYVAARLAFSQGDLEPAGVLLTDSIGLARAAGDDATLAAAIGCSGWLCEERGERENALALISECREVSAGITDRAEALPYVIQFLRMTADIKASDALSHELLAVTRERGDVLGLAGILNDFGYSALANGDYDEARPLLEESLAISRELDVTFLTALALGNLGLLAFVEGRYEQATELFGDDLRLCVTRGDRRCGSEAILGLAAAHAALGNTELALRLDRIQRDLHTAAGIVYPARLHDLLDRPISEAREQRGPACARVLATELEPTLEAALAALDVDSSTRDVRSAP